jgi:glycosyltransferase involved in cell wall biosynthesis
MSRLNNPIRIAVLGTRGFPNVQGGIERHCEELYPRLVSLGCIVTVFGRKGYVPDMFYEFKGVQVVPLWTVKKKSIEAIVHTFYGLVLIAVRRNKFDIVHIHGIGPALVVPLARLFGLKVVVTNHGSDYERAKWGTTARLFLRTGELLGTRFASAVIAVSKQIKNMLEVKYRRSVVYIPNGVTIRKQVPNNTIKKKYALEPGKYLLAVGRLVPEKGFHDLVEAYAGVESDWKLVIAGGADHEDNYSSMLRDQSSRDPRIVMTGFITGDLLAEIYSHAGLLILPSYHEGLSITILEAMSYNLPILASEIPANRELLADENVLFKPGDIDVLRKKIKEFISGDNRKGISMVFQERINTEFNWNTIAQETKGLYSTIVNPR